MLVAVNVVGGRLPLRFERVELALDGGAHGIGAQAPQGGARHQRRQRLAVARRHGKRAGPVQMQPHIHLAAQRLPCTR